MTPAEIEAERAELLPCPFCGGPALGPHRSTLAQNLWHVSCKNCDASRQGTLGRNPELAKQHAIAAWNRRSSSSPALVKQMAEAVPKNDAETIAALKADTPFNRARREFSSWAARIEQASLQRAPTSPIESRRMEFQAVAAIVGAALASLEAANVG